jgi:hypothetical protein
MWLGLSGRYRARWSLQIHDEWKRNLLINRPALTPEQLDRTSGLMDLAIPDGLVVGHELLISGLTLPDPDDRHVLAAAIRCNASVIVTFNEKDFPATALAPYVIEAQHPDLFVDNLFDLDGDSAGRSPTTGSGLNEAALGNALRPRTDASVVGSTRMFSRSSRSASRACPKPLDYDSARWSMRSAR